MGYDMRLYVVDKSDMLGYDENTKDKKFASVEASVELYKTDDIVDSLRLAPPTDCYIHEGDEVLVEDMYGKPLTEVSLQEAISKLQAGLAATGGYRRYQIALSLLQGFVLAGMTDVVVLQYGH